MKKSKLLIFVLIWTVIISALTPINVYASDSAYSTGFNAQFFNKNSTQIGSFEGSFPKAFDSTNHYQSELYTMEIDVDVPLAIKKGEKVDIELITYSTSRYLSWYKIYLIDYDESNAKHLYDDVNVNYKYSSGTISISFTANHAIKTNEQIEIGLAVPTYTSGFSSNTSLLIFRLTSAEFTITSESSSFFSKVGDWFSNLFEKLGSWFNGIFEWFQKLSDNIKSLFTDLINKITTEFKNIIDNLKTWFSNIGQWFSELGDRISGFFASLGDRVSSFFEKLWNRIYWGNDNGESEYQKPVIDNKLNDILAKLQEYQEQLKSAILTINSATENVSSYISTGTQLVNGVISVAGVGFTALIVFGIVFILVRKVVGR